MLIPYSGQIKLHIFNTENFLKKTNLVKMFGLKFLPRSSGTFPNTKNMIFIFSDEGRKNANRNSGSV